MKSSKVSFSKALLSLSFIILILISSCAQSGNSDGAKSENNSKAKSTVEKPKIDLQTAIMTDNLEAVKQHIESGTDIDRIDQMSGSTPLITAATFDKRGIVKALVDAGADLTIQNNDGSTALHVAAFFCRIEIVQILIDAKADNTIRNNYGATPRETIMAPFADMKPIYEMLQLQLEPFGFKLDLMELEKSRPVVAMMLQ